MVLAMAYVAHYCFSGPSLIPMIVIAAFWGAAHTSGVSITQIWLTSEAPEAPEFATGLYIAFINLGVTIGSRSGAWFIARVGMQGALGSGLLFATLAVMLVSWK
jgi:predicted MFS family arabinose efflux permease